MFSLPTTIPTLKIVGIDPGTSTLGLAVLEIDATTYDFISISATTYQGKYLPGYDKQLSKMHGDSFARVHAYRSYLLDKFNLINPSVIASEAPFFHRLHPAAFAPLVEIVSAIKEAVYYYDAYMPLTTVPPLNVKRAIMAQGNDKSDMRTALERYTPFSIASSIIAAMDEHSIDACAVCAYVFNQLHSTKGE